MNASLPKRPKRRQRRLRIGSLCSGYGGLDLAAETVFKGQVVWVADNDPAAAHVLATRFPKAPNLGDITAIDWREVPPVDVVACGFPCQDISNAGTRTGITGTRSSLWKHVVEGLRALSPPLVVLENVAALRVRGLDVVQSDLATLGYDTRWLCLRASAIGAAHHRDRMFILAHRGALPRVRRQR